MNAPAIKNGLLGGAAVVLYFLTLYAAGIPKFMHLGLQWGSMAFYLLFMYMASEADCRENGTARDIREIIRTPFIVFLLINLCYWLFYYGIHLYDPALIGAEMLAEKTRLQAEIDGGLGDPAAANQYRERIAELDRLIPDPGIQPLGPILTRMCVGALGGFALSALTALYMRSKSKF